MEVLVRTRAERGAHNFLVLESATASDQDMEKQKDAPTPPRFFFLSPSRARGRSRWHCDARPLMAWPGLKLTTNKKDKQHRLGTQASMPFLRKPAHTPSSPIQQHTAVFVISLARKKSSIIHPSPCRTSSGKRSSALGRSSPPPPSAAGSGYGSTPSSPPPASAPRRWWACPPVPLL